MNANLKISVQGLKTQIQDLLAQVCVSVPDCEQFNMVLHDPMKSMEPDWQMELDIVTNRELIQEVMEIVNNAELDKANCVVKMNY
ncbi:hypothetical protein [Dyadobacter psychrotolerans]|uniref:Uncharacterized protein n=1 Tax=Dyadobacter psychrotolerans TaxID=2541721 RepID=A0A4R5DMC0_9BACT|nr:hypothetical protein [Dyadobacter psychrotolerans]TDE15279.1 hypothetical protein E0F88_12205 [Dyadobacter psychrotolerans]